MNGLTDEHRLRILERADESEEERVGSLWGCLFTSIDGKWLDQMCTEGLLVCKRKGQYSVNTVDAPVHEITENGRLFLAQHGIHLIQRDLNHAMEKANHLQSRIWNLEKLL